MSFVDIAHEQISKQEGNFSIIAANIYGREIEVEKTLVYIKMGQIFMGNKMFNCRGKITILIHIDW